MFVPMIIVVLLQSSYSFATLCGNELYREGSTGANTSELVTVNKQSDGCSMSNYAGHPEYSGIILGHIILVVVAWTLLLPFVIVFSIAKSRRTLQLHMVFMVCNGTSLCLATIYNFKTPDLYPNNAHHAIGWIATCIMSLHAIMIMATSYASQSRDDASTMTERVALLPFPTAIAAQQDVRCRFTDTVSAEENDQCIAGSRVCSDALVPDMQTPPLCEDGEDAELDNTDGEHENLVDYRTSLTKYLSISKSFITRPSERMSWGLLKMARILVRIIDRLILVFGFVALITGGVTYTGILCGRHIFNGLAHFIKGGIFFWYGLLTLGRWMGCFADFGWAWNVQPAHSRRVWWISLIPSAEFVESFVIFLYGGSNIFLEHLAAWGGTWSAQDLEHVSISIMFLGGGMCGMLVESKQIRGLLSTSIDLIYAPSLNNSARKRESRIPDAHSVCTNPMPALIIFLLGVVMSSHHQDSMVSTAIHRQWGMLLSTFSAARILTCILVYISPPTSIYPSRPPTELISSFCLISGGIIFMASTTDIVHWMEDSNLMATFVFTIAMALTALTMAHVIAMLSFKGWLMRRDTGYYAQDSHVSRELGTHS